MPKSWIETAVALAVVGVCLVLAALLGLWGYMSATPPLHPSLQDVHP